MAIRPPRLVVPAIIIVSFAACGDEPRRRLGAVCGEELDCQGICSQGMCLDPAGDEDLDGLQNELELALGTDLFSADSDGDGARDPDELDAALANLDGDGDGAADALESSLLDDDRDCVADQFDAANTVFDGPDSDGDGLGDACDAHDDRTPELLRVKGTRWTLVDANTLDQVDLRVSGKARAGASVTFLIDGVAHGSAVADATGRFEGVASAVDAAAPGVRRLELEAGGAGPRSPPKEVVGTFTATFTLDGRPLPGVPGVLQFPDGSAFVDGASNAGGILTHRIFAGMMGTFAIERDSGTRKRRVLGTYMDLMPGSALPIDVTPPPAAAANGAGSDLVVTLPAPPSGAATYLLQSSCGGEVAAPDVPTEVRLTLSSDCARVGERVDLLATALASEAVTPAGGSRVVAYAFRADVALTSQETAVALGPWLSASSPGSTLVTSTFSLHNDGAEPLTGMLLSQHYRGPRADDFDISQLKPGGLAGFVASLSLAPGATLHGALPFISEIGPWRRILAVPSRAAGAGPVAVRYQIEQGVGTPPAAFASLSVGADLLPEVTRDLSLPRGPDPDRPTLGWSASGSLEGADVAVMRLQGVHNCSPTCDELEWRIAWRPWDADAALTLPSLPAGLTPAGFWSPSGQASFDIALLAWLELDFADGWDEAQRLGNGFCPFGDESFFRDTVPPEAHVRATFLRGE